jgi:ATP-dependent Lon protease
MKTLALILTLTQLTVAQAHATDATPEARLMKQVIALEGEDSLSQADLNSRLSKIISTYVATSSEDGRDARLRDALVSLRVETPEQADAMVSELNSSAARVQEAGVDKQSEVLNSELSRLIQIQPQGAEFSACRAGAYLWAGLLVGGVLMNAASPSGSHIGRLGIYAFYASIPAGLFVGTHECQMTPRDLSIHVGI